MIETQALAALLIGLAGGMHCVGMCGGIVAALSFGRGGPSVPVSTTIAYNVGRIASYCVAGGIAGLLGHAGVALRGSAVVHQALFGVASLALLVSGLYLSGYAPFLRRAELVGAGLWKRIEPWSRPLIPVTNAKRALALGALWGWLPCGMVYAALLLALGTGSPWGGAVTMAAFGIGTLPNLLGLGVAVSRSRNHFASPRLRCFAGILVAALGLWGLVQVVGHVSGFPEICIVRLPG